MKTDPSSPWLARLEELLLDSRTRQLTSREQTELNDILRTHAPARAHAAQFLLDDAALADCLREAQVEAIFHDEGRSRAGIRNSFAAESIRSAWFQWRPLTAAAAGLVFGLCTATMVWAYTSPRVVAEARRLSALVDGSFEKQPGHVAAGFPLEAGVWSGDGAEVVSMGATARDGKRVLRFLKADREPNSPNSPTNACDVYQIVDLRPLREMQEAAGESTLELSAEFLDARTASSAPVIFRCNIYLFHGSADSLHAHWPEVAPEALGTGSAYVLGSGSPDGGKWHKITARCVLPANADFCVLRLSAGRDEFNGGPVPELGMQFADDVKLILKTQPEVPVRFVQH